MSVNLENGEDAVIIEGVVEIASGKPLIKRINAEYNAEVSLGGHAGRVVRAAAAGRVRVDLRRAPAWDGGRVRGQRYALAVEVGVRC